MIEGLDRAIKEVLEESGECNWWIITVRDARKRKNSKPIDIFCYQTRGSLADAMAELFGFEPRAELVALEAMAIEARRMTQAEIDEWDRECEREERREARMR